MQRSKKTKGLSLLEMLVAMAVMGILLGVIVQFFVTQSRAARLQKAINEASEAGRTAMSLITWDLQNAGYRVDTSSTKLAIDKNGNNGYKDSLKIRYRDDSIKDSSGNPKPTEMTVTYSISQGDLLRDEDLAGDPNNDSETPSVASIVAMNIRYETRPDQFATPISSGGTNTCKSGQTPIMDGGKVINCSVDWTFADIPQRLVRQVKVQLLARSETPVGKQNTTSFKFDGVSGSYTPTDEYIYQMVEQTIIVPNLGR